MAEKTIYCSNCGAEVTEDMAFCSSCGGALKTGVRPPAEQVVVAAPEPEKKKRNPLITILALLGLLLLLAIICSSLSDNGSSSSRSSSPARSVPTSYRVEYKLSGTARRVDITYENENGNTEQRDNIALPNSMTFSASPGRFLYISAQNQGETGSVKCQIVLNGEVVEEATSEGSYVIATCSRIAGAGD